MQDEPPDPMDLLVANGGVFLQVSPTQTVGMSAPLTEEVLDTKLQSLLQNLTYITREIGIIAQELRGEIVHLGKRTDTLQNKFDHMVQYVHILEGDNTALKHTASQLTSQQEVLENRERHQH